MSASETSSELACTHCGSQLEATAKVYFDLTAAERGSDGKLEITGLAFSDLNDSFDGHPVALESELVVSCAECGERSSFRLAGAALLGIAFAGGASEFECLLSAARDVYECSREGQAAVEEWARGEQIAPHINYRHCGPCEASTPHIASVCVICESVGGWGSEESAEPPLISVVYSEADIRDYAEEAGVPAALALRRAQEWARPIQETAANLCAEQLLSVVRSGQP